MLCYCACKATAREERRKENLYVINDAHYSEFVGEKNITVKCKLCLGNREVSVSLEDSNSHFENAS